MHTNQLTLGLLSTGCWSSVGRVWTKYPSLGWLSIKQDANQGYWLAVAIHTQLWVPLVHIIQIFTNSEKLDCHWIATCLLPESVHWLIFKSNHWIMMKVYKWLTKHMNTTSSCQNYNIVSSLNHFSCANWRVWVRDTC